MAIHFSSLPALAFLITPHKSWNGASITNPTNTMDPLDFYEDDLQETRAERLAYDEEVRRELEECWDGEGRRQGGDVTMQEVVIGGRAADVAMREAVPDETVVPKATPPIAADPSAPAILFGNQPATTSTNKDQTKDAAKTKYLQQLSKRVKSTPVISRSKTVQIIPDPASTSKPQVKGKEKAPSLPVPLPSMIAPQGPAPKPQKISPKLQIILLNHTAFIHATSGTKPPKQRKVKGMVAMDKINVGKVSEVFKGCVVAVVHHLSAKPEQLVTRWTIVSSPLSSFRSGGILISCVISKVHQHGGEACVRYTPEVTHIACDHDVTDSALCEYLGIKDMAELPKGLPVVAWDWFVKCQSVSPSIYRDRRMRAERKG
jgi:hypothetical protein